MPKALRSRIQKDLFSQIAELQATFNRVVEMLHQLLPYSVEEWPILDQGPMNEDLLQQVISLKQIYEQIHPPLIVHINFASLLILAGHYYLRQGPVNEMNSVLQLAKTTCLSDDGENDTMCKIIVDMVDSSSGQLNAHGGIIASLSRDTSRPTLHDDKSAEEIQAKLELPTLDGLAKLDAAISDSVAGRKGTKLESTPSLELDNTTIYAAISLQCSNASTRPQSLPLWTWTLKRDMLAFQPGVGAIGTA